VIHPPSLWPEARPANWNAAVPINSPMASVDRCFMKASSLFVLIGRQTITSMREVNAISMLQVRFARHSIATHAESRLARS
jgi:hypothetical protein